MKKLIFTLLLSTTWIHAGAQEAQNDEQTTQKTTSSPSIQGERQYVPEENLNKEKPVSEKMPNYGSLVIDWGLNFLRSGPPTMYKESWGARFNDLCIYYNIRLGNSSFTLSPGIGLSFDRYKLKEGYMPGSSNTNTDIVRTDIDHTTIISSALDVRYLDFALELRFNANKQHPKENLFIAIGGKLGMLWKACDTIRYKQKDDEVKERNRWENFNLNGIRYGLQVKAGWGRIGLCYTHLLNSLFNKGNRPAQLCSIGLSIDLF